MINKDIRNMFNGQITVEALNGQYESDIDEFDYNSDIYGGDIAYPEEGDPTVSNALFIGTFTADDNGHNSVEINCVGAHILKKDIDGVPQAWDIYITNPYNDVYITLRSFYYIIK